MKLIPPGDIKKERKAIRERWEGTTAECNLLNFRFLPSSSCLFSFPFLSFSFFLWHYIITYRGGRDSGRDHPCSAGYGCKRPRSGKDYRRTSSMAWWLQMHFKRVGYKYYNHDFVLFTRRIRWRWPTRSRCTGTKAVCGLTDFIAF